MDTEIEILIVGAGPSGLALSCELKRLGIRAITVDRQAAGVSLRRSTTSY
jgi:cation diffusion facilitator CzcD-associated flavoprotein CzcO